MYPLWTFLAVALLLAGVYEEWRAPRRRIARVLRATEALREGRVLAPDESPLRTAARWLAVRVRPWLPTGRVEELREWLLWAGRPFGLSAEEFFFARLAIAMGAAILFWIVSSGNPGLAIVAAGIGYLLPERWLKQRVEERTRQIRVDLPHFIHLLATALEAGLPVTEAVRRVANEAPGLLAAEMLRTVQEMAAGKPAALAWQHLSRRTNCQELREVATAIIQSQEFGVAVAEQLRFQMRAIRVRKQQQAQERAQAASVKMKIPVVLFILAPTMVILLGPAAISVMAQLRGG